MIETDSSDPEYEVLPKNRQSVNKISRSNGKSSFKKEVNDMSDVVVISDSGDEREGK